MKRKNRYYPFIHPLLQIWRLQLKTLMVFISASLTLSSCSEDGVVFQSPELEQRKDYFVGITLSGQYVDEKSVNYGKTFTTRDTRADEESYESGNIDENYINPYDLYILAFDIPSGTTLSNDSKLIDILWSPEIAKEESSITEVGSDLYLRTNLDKDNSIYNTGKDFCIVVLANLNSFSQEAGTSIDLKPSTNGLIIGKNFSELMNSAHYSFKGSNNNWKWMPSKVQKRGLPMFGVMKVNLKNYSFKVYNEFNPYPLESSDGSKVIRLLRAFSKVEVSLSDDLFTDEIKNTMGDISISSASIGLDYAVDYWVIPELDPMRGFETTSNTSMVDKLRESDNKGTKATLTSSNLSFTKINDRKAVVYIPEYPLWTESTTAPDGSTKVNEVPKINVSLNIGNASIGYSSQDFSFYLHKNGLKPDSNTIPTEAVWKNILRNRYYKFEVKVGFNVISVESDDWDNTFDNDFSFG